MAVSASILRWLQIAGGLFIALVIGFVGYRLIFSGVESDIYRQKLTDLENRYDSLAANYNQAVRKTAVTELVVADGKLSVAIRTVEGVDKVIQTPFDPSREIYCDYVLVDGRLWIRRVYDDRTPPKDGLVIDQKFQYVDWNAPTARYGKAVYRSLTSGRWIITVTGDGSLGLAPADAKQVQLSGPAPVRDYEQVQQQIDRKIADLSFGDILRYIFGSGRTPSK